MALSLLRRCVSVRLATLVLTLAVRPIPVPTWRCISAIYAMACLPVYGREMTAGFSRDFPCSSILFLQTPLARVSKPAIRWGNRYTGG